MFRFLFGAGALLTIALMSQTAKAQLRFPTEEPVSYLSCTSLESLVNVLDLVVNEQQLYNNSHDIVRTEHKCTLNYGPEDVAFVRGRPRANYIGWYLTEPVDKSEPRFWIQIHKFMTRDGVNRYRVYYVRRESLFALPRICTANSATLPGRDRDVRLYGTEIFKRFDSRYELDGIHACS